MIERLLPVEVFAFLLVFCRIGGAVVIMPGFGEAFISPRVRLFIAFVITLVTAPVVVGTLPAMPDAVGSLVLLIAGEVLVGVFIGTLVRLLLAALATAGTVIAFVSGLASALAFNPLLADQGSLPSAFLTLLGLVLIFVTNLHHLMLLAVFDSYSLFVPGVAPEIGDMAMMVGRTVADSFALGLQLAAPFMVVAFMFYVLIGLLARLMPQMQVFFIAIPMQILLGFFVFSIVLTSVMLWFLTKFQESLIPFLAPG